jgi:thymidylate synthase
LSADPPPGIVVDTSALMAILLEEPEMHIVSETLDDVLRNLYLALLNGTNFVTASRGATVEIVGVLVEILQPRARLSRTETRGKPFSCLGELLWYLSRDNSLDFIRYYIPRYACGSEDGVTVYGGYGPRLFNHRGHNQLCNVIALLRDKPSSRRATIQLFDAEDISRHHVEVPCTTTLQFMVRDGLVHMLTTMRSNDAYLGLPHDVFCFTILQEIVARSLGCELGFYKHFVGSMHLYDTHRADAQQYVDEELQPRIEMPAMPEGNPWPSIQRLLEAEHQIRNKKMINAGDWGVDPYWADLIRLLQIFAANGDELRIKALKSAMNFRRYGAYIDGRLRMKRRTPPALS